MASIRLNVFGEQISTLMETASLRKSLNELEQSQMPEVSTENSRP